MGVMECFRVGCENIMCSRYSREHGYLCEDCFEELVAKGPTADIDDFMHSRKETDQAKNAARARFEVEFPSRD